MSEPPHISAELLAETAMFLWAGALSTGSQNKPGQAQGGEIGAAEACRAFAYHVALADLRFAKRVQEETDTGYPGVWNYEVLEPLGELWARHEMPFDPHTEPGQLAQWLDDYVDTWSRALG